MSLYGTPTYSEVLMAANAAVTVFRSRGIECCLVGGVACKLYGNPRTPNDVDLLVLDTTYAQEELKSILCRHNSKFYTVASKNPRATYRVLWYRLPTITYRSCKVDILQPGVMNIPLVPTELITWKKVIHPSSSITATSVGSGDAFIKLPRMPFSGVLLLKLQAWEDHRYAGKSYLVEKQYVDVRDLESLLAIGLQRKIQPRKEAWIPTSFVLAAERRVRDFVLSYPETRQQWRLLGFRTS